MVIVGSCGVEDADDGDYSFVSKMVKCMSVCFSNKKNNQWSKKPESATLYKLMPLLILLLNRQSSWLRNGSVENCFFLVLRTKTGNIHYLA